MANETVISRPSNMPYLIIEHWSRILTREAIGRLWFRRFLGTSSRSILQLHRDTTRDRGDTIRYDLLLQLSGYGRHGETQLRDNEQQLEYAQDQVVIDQLREGIAYRTMSQQRTRHQLRQDGAANLGDFFGRVFDEMMLATLNGTAGDNSALATAATTFGGFELTPHDTDHLVDRSGSKFKLDDITALREMAKTGPPVSASPGDHHPIIRPIKVENGEDVYALILHPYQCTSLKTELGPDAWRTFVSNAQVRGSSNPLFTGALGMWDGVVIHESIYAPRGDTAGASGYTLNNPGGDVNFACLVGAQAGHVAFGQSMRQLGRRQDVGRNEPLFQYMEDATDYGDRTGISGSTIVGLKRGIFDAGHGASTYGCITLASTDAAAA